MKEQYGWITELKEILDSFPDAGTDYEEVALIKRIQTLVNKDVRELWKELSQPDWQVSRLVRKREPS